MTASRIFLCPAIIAGFQHKRFVLGFGLFAFACISDYLDGYFAKRFKATTKLGSLLDPMADKIFSITLFSLLMGQGMCPAWFLGLLIAISLIQCLGLAVLKLPGAGPKSAFNPLRAGKWNTALQFIWMAILIADLCLTKVALPPLFVTAGYLLVGTAQIVVFFRYFYRFRLLLSKHLSLSGPRLPQTA